MMPLWLLLFAVAATHLPLVSTQETPASPPDPINIKELVKGDAYFIRKSCASKNIAEKDMLAKLESSMSDECDVVVHTRKRGSKNLLVQIQIRHVPADSAKLNQAKSIKLVQGPFSIECNPDTKTVTSTQGISIGTNPGPIVFFSEDQIFCSFIMKGDKELSLEFKKNSNTPKLEFHTGTTDLNEITYGSDEDKFWNEGITRCDPEFLIPMGGTEYKEGPPAKHFYDVKDVAADNLECAKGRLSIKPAIFVESITCGKDWEYKPIDASDTRVLDKPFEPVCIFEYCTVCEDVVPFPCKTCTTPNRDPPSGDDCSTISCPPTAKNWYINGEWVNDAKPECSGNKDKESKWRVMLKDKEVEVKSAACTSKFECHKYQPLDLTCDYALNLDACILPTSKDNNNTFECLDEKMKKMQVGEEDIVVRNSVACNPDIGFYMNNDEQIPKGTAIACVDPNSEADRNARYAEELTHDAKVKAGALFGVALALAVIIPVAAYLVVEKLNKRDRAKKEAHEANMKKQALARKSEAVTDPKDPNGIKSDKIEQKSGQKSSSGQSTRLNNLTRLQKTDKKRKGSKESSKSNHSEGRKTKSNQMVPGRDSEVEIADSKDSSYKSEKSSRSSEKEKMMKKGAKDKFFRRKVGGYRAPPLDNYEITDKNLVPTPRFPPNGIVPQHSTAMEICNKRLADLKKREKGTTTASASVIPTDGGGEKGSKSKEEKIPSKKN